MLDFRRVKIEFFVSHLNQELALQNFTIIINKHCGKYRIKYKYSLTIGEEIEKQTYINRSYFNQIYYGLLGTDFKNIKENNPYPRARRDGSSTELWVKNIFKKIYCEVFVLEHFNKEYKSIEYLHNIIDEILKIENIDKYWYI